MIARRLTVLNLLLLGLCVVYGAIILPSWLTPPRVGRAAPTEETVPAESTELRPTAEVRFPPFADFAGVAEKNLFHPDRTYTKPEPAAGPPPTLPTFVLYGIIEAGPASVAMIEDKKAPVSTKGRGKRLVSLRLGDVFGGYRLDSVSSDSVVMVYGEERLTVPLVDPGNPKQRAAVKPAAQPPARGAATKARRKKNLADAFRIPQKKRGEQK